MDSSESWEDEEEFKVNPKPKKQALTFMKAPKT